MIPLWIKRYLWCVFALQQSPQKCLTVTRASPLQTRTKANPPGVHGMGSALLGFTLTHFNPAGSSWHSDLPEQLSCGSTPPSCPIMCFSNPTFHQFLLHSNKLQPRDLKKVFVPVFSEPVSGSLWQLCSTALLMCNYSNKGKKGKNLPGNCYWAARIAHFWGWLFIALLLIVSKNV